MASRIAKILFIADSTDFSYGSSISQEQEQIKQIRREFAPYLYNHKAAPKELIDRLGPIAEKLIADTPDGEELAAMYEPDMSAAQYGKFLNGAMKIVDDDCQ